MPSGSRSMLAEVIATMMLYRSTDGRHVADITASADRREKALRKRMRECDHAQQLGEVKPGFLCIVISVSSRSRSTDCLTHLDTRI
jgi:hypothetical protein